MKKSFFHWKDKTLSLRVQIQTRASRDQIVGVHGDALKISLTAPPVEGQANAHLIKFLARLFAVPQKQVTITHGLKSRIKIIIIESPQKLPENLLITLSKP